MDVYRIRINCPRCGKITPYIVSDNTLIENHCSHCQARLSLPSETFSGYVYLLINKHMPDLVKIGFTDRDPFIRCSELSKSTGVPSDFEVFCYYLKNRASAFEAEIHSHFKVYRVPGKEFFSLLPDQAVNLIERKFGAKPDYINFELTRFNSCSEQPDVPKSPPIHPKDKFGGENSYISRIDYLSKVNGGEQDHFVELSRKKVFKAPVRRDVPLPEGYEAQVRCKHCQKMNMIKTYDLSVLKAKCGSCGKYLN